MLQAIKYSKGQLEILDQLQLPFIETFIPIRSTEDGWHAIKDMKVRGGTGDRYRCNACTRLRADLGRGIWQG